jgi:predicted RNase H-like HicB family nuclease
MVGYIAIIDGKAGAFGAYIPDLPGCTAMGDTVDEATANIAAAARDWLKVTIEKGLTEPRSRSIVELQAEQEVSDDLGEGARFERVNL